MSRASEIASAARPRDAVSAINGQLLRRVRARKCELIALIARNKSSGGVVIGFGPCTFSVGMRELMSAEGEEKEVSRIRRASENLSDIYTQASSLRTTLAGCIRFLRKFEGWGWGIYRGILYR